MILAYILWLHLWTLINYVRVYVYYKIWKIKKYKSNQSILLSKTYQWLRVSLRINPESSAWAPEAPAHFSSLLQNIPPLHSMSQTHVSCGPPVPTLQPSYSSLTLHTCCFSLPRTSPHSYFLGWLLLIFIGLNLNIKFSGGRLWSPDMVRYPDTYSHWFSVLIKILFYY